MVCRKSVLKCSNELYLESMSSKPFLNHWCLTRRKNSRNCNFTITGSNDYDFFRRNFDVVSWFFTNYRSLRTQLFPYSLFEFERLLRNHRRNEYTHSVRNFLWKIKVEINANLWERVYKKSVSFKFQWLILLAYCIL